MTENRYISQLEKSSSLAVAGLWHLGQNAVTDSLMRSPRFGRHIANAFHQGLHGVHEGSLKRKLTSAATSIASPEMEILYRKANEAGHRLRPRVENLPKRVQVGLRQIFQGRFSDFDRLKGRMHLTEDHRKSLDAGMSEVQKLTGVPVKTLVKATPKIKASVQKEWSSPNHPLLSNIVARFGKGTSQVTKPVSGPMKDTSPLLPQIALAPLEPVGAALNAAKGATSLASVRKLPVLGTGIKKVEDYFTKHQVELGMAQPALNPGVGGVKNLVSRFGINPMSHSLKNTSSTFTFLKNQAKKELTKQP